MIFSKIGAFKLFFQKYIYEGVLLIDDRYAEFD
jgi:hypothetical protein